MSATTHAAPSLGDLPSVLRDDGPLARALGARVGPLVPAPAELLILAGLVPLLAVAAVAGRVPIAVAAAVLAWALLAVAASRGRPLMDKSRWAQPPLVRLTEYGGLIWIASLSGASAYPAAFALLAALTFRHYDLAYRLRQRGALPARWVSALAGGWEGRLVLGWVLLAADALPAGLFVAAGVLGAAFVGEAAAGWLARRGEAAHAFDDEGDVD